MLHLGDLDSRGRPRETRLAGLEFTGGAEVSLATAVDASHPEPVSEARSQGLGCPPLVVLGPWQLHLERGRRWRGREQVEERKQKTSGNKEVQEIKIIIIIIHFIYIALFKVLKVALQIPAIIQSNRWRYGSVAANQRLRPLRPPPTFITNIQSHSYDTCLYDGGGNRSTQRKPMQARGEHVNSTQMLRKRGGEGEVKEEKRIVVMFPRKARSSKKRSITQIGRASCRERV